jgi:hypothetical protein
MPSGTAADSVPPDDISGLSVFGRQLREKPASLGAVDDTGLRGPACRKDQDTVIVMAWHATATAEGADAYREHFTRAIKRSPRPRSSVQGAGMG